MSPPYHEENVCHLSFRHNSVLTSYVVSVVRKTIGAMQTSFSHLRKWPLLSSAHAKPCFLVHWIRLALCSDVRRGQRKIFLYFNSEVFWRTICTVRFEIESWSSVCKELAAFSHLTVSRSRWQFCAEDSSLGLSADFFFPYWSGFWRNLATTFRVRFDFVAIAVWIQLASFRAIIFPLSSSVSFFPQPMLELVNK